MAPELPAARRVAATSRRIREQRARRRFERTFWVLVASLAVLSAVFLLLGSMQGPKLSSAVVDPARVTEQPGQQLRLFANQPLGEVTAEQVTVTPEADVSVSVQNELLDPKVRLELRMTIDPTERRGQQEWNDLEHLAQSESTVIKHRTVARAHPHDPLKRSPQGSVQAFKTTIVLGLSMTHRCMMTTSIQWTIAAGSSQPTSIPTTRLSKRLDQGDDVDVDDVRSHEAMRT